MMKARLGYCAAAGAMALVGMFAISALQPADAQQRKSIRWTTSQVGSYGYTIAASMAKVLEQALAGEYTVNVYHFIAMGREPVPVSVKVEKLNPTVQVVHYSTMMLERAGTERTAVRFSIDGSGVVQDVNSRDKSLLQTLRRWRNGAD